MYTLEVIDDMSTDDKDDINLEFSFHTKDLVEVFFDGALLENIHDSDSSLDIHCNAGVATVNKIGNLPSYGVVWYHPGGIANILSLAQVKENIK